MKIQHVAGVIVLAASVSVTCAMAGDDATKDQQKLIEVLRSHAPAGEKAITCKRLAIYGGKEAVPALAPLLADEKLSSWARIPLEVIPGPAADEALRQAMDKVQGRLLVGVINSIGVRRAAGAVASLVARLNDHDAEVASVSAVALGRIGNDAAATALEGALAGAVPAVRSAAAEGCILCAERRLAAGKAAQAATIYDLVRKADLPKQRIREATRGAILARKTTAAPLLVELLRSSDKEMFSLALTVARELPGKDTADVLVAELAKTTPERQSLLIVAIADRGDATALTAVLRAAKSGPDSVKITVVKVLRRLGDASSVPLLLELAVDGNPALAKTAVESLASLAGKEVDAEIAARLATAEGKVRLVLLQLVGDRLLTAAMPEVIKASSDPDLQIRLQALTTLGYAVEFKDLSVLIDRVAATPEKAEEAKAAEVALKTACQRMPDADACAAKVVAAMGAAKVPARINLLEVLTALGGKKALEAVAVAAADSNGDIQDASSRLLGKWMTLDAAPVLANLAKSAADAKYEVRSVRAYVRLVRQFPMPEQKRIEMCRAAMAIAKRDAEKKLVLDVLARYPSLEGLQLASEAAKTASLKPDATKAVLVITQKIGGNSPQIQQILTQLGQKQVKIEILRAEYGAGKKLKDVTDLVRQSVHGFPLLILKGSMYNEAFGGDPAPGALKKLQVEYSLNGKKGKAAFAENATIILPNP
jgi:HEAT repeat protein